MYGIQEQEERDFMPMSYAEESAWQHRNYGTCSFDCAACEPPYDEQDELESWQDELERMSLLELEEHLDDMWRITTDCWRREFTLPSSAEIIAERNRNVWF